jgi:hypothetical protein
LLGGDLRRQYLKCGGQNGRPTIAQLHDYSLK